MKTLHAYLTRQIIGSLLMTVAVFTFAMLTISVLKEVMPLLVNGQMKVGIVAQAVGLLVPFVWVFALPLGMLTATLLIFGRFSADQELTAVRASGISLLTVVSPILLLSVALCVLSAAVNLEFGPRCRVAYNNLRLRVQVGVSAAYLPEGRFVDYFDGYIFYVGKNKKGDLEDVMVFGLKDQRTIHAKRAKLELDAPNQQLVLTLYDFKIVQDRRNPAGSMEMTLVLPLPRTKERPGKPGIDNMTFTELRAELREMEKRLSVPVSATNLSREQLDARKKEWETQAKELATSPIIYYMHQQVAFSFACFGFTLVGIPLGIRMHRRETNIGIFIALILAVAYYVFVLLAQALARHPEYAPHLIVWVPNLLFQGVGAVLLWRANRGT